MNADTPRFDDPQLTVRGPRFRKREKVLQSGNKGSGCRTRIQVQDHDPGTRLRRKPQDLTEVAIEGDKGPSLGAAYVEEALVSGASEVLAMHRRHVVAVGLEHLRATTADILVQFELHATRPTGTGTTRSRAASAP